MALTYDEHRLCSTLAWWANHRNGNTPPCQCVDDAVKRNADLKAPHKEEDVRHLWPVALQMVRNAEALQGRMKQIAALIKEGKPVPPDLDCRLCDLPGVVRPEGAE